MNKLISRLLSSLIIIFAVFAKLPIQEEFSNKTLFGLNLFTIYAVMLVISAYIFSSLIKISKNYFLIKQSENISLLLSGYFLLGLIFKKAFPPYPFSFLILAITFILFIFVSENSKKIKGSGLISIILFVLSFSSLEMNLRRLPQGILVHEVQNTPPLVKEDQVNIVYKKNGFRSKKPCTDCKKNNVRIITMGGSSTYGVPMHYSSKTYSAELQRILNKKRIQDNFEVLNGGVAAMGITQINAALEEELLQFKPDIVTICEWFNDSASSPRWYRMPGMSDIEGYKKAKLLRKIQNLPGLKQIRNSKIYALSRYYLISLRDKFKSKSETLKIDDTRPRMTPEEYKLGLENIIKLSKDYDFVPVFIVETFHRSLSINKIKETNPYVKVLYDVAKDNNIDVVDPATPMSNNKEPWLFYDFIHPNPAGHKIIAESIFDKLFGDNISDNLKKVWDKKNIINKIQNAKADYFFQIEKEKLEKGNLNVKIKSPYLKGTTNLELYADNELIKTKTNLTDKESVFSFNFSKNELKLFDPIIDFNLKSRQINSSQEFTMPAFIEVTSGGKDYGWTSQIAINGETFDYNLRGLNAVMIGAESGEIKKTELFDFYVKDQSTEFEKFINSSTMHQEHGKNPIIILAANTDFHFNVRNKTRNLLKQIGGSGKTPGPFESFILIGQLNLEKDNAIEEMGKKLIKKEAGSKERISEKLIEVSDIWITDNR